MPTFFIDELGGEQEATNWYSHNYATYIRLAPGWTEARAEAELEPFLISRAGDELREPFEARLMPYSRLHLEGDYRGVGMAGLIGMFILLIACINTMNLATARSLKRAREIGVRKVLGGTRAALAAQFMIEALLLVLAALAMALLLVELALPGFEALLGIPLEAALTLPTHQIVLAIAAVALLCTLLAGGYPALVLSGFQPARVLKAGGGLRAGGHRLRTVLVTLQFTVTLSLIFGTLTVLAQHRHLLARELGFDKDGLVYLTLRGEETRSRAGVLKERLLRSPRVESVSVHSQIIGRTTGGVWTVSTPGMGDDEEAVFTVFTDPDYVETLGLNLAWGRAFDPDRPADKMESFLVNERFIERFGIDVDADPGLTLNHTGREGRIIGVIKNYHFQPLQQVTEPVVVSLTRNNWDNLRVAIRISPGPVDEALREIEAAWIEVEPRLPLTYHFLDEWLGENYRDEQRLARLLAVFATLAIVVASLGLLGMAAYATEIRTREIGIRKVLGADSLRIVLLLTRQFLVPVIVANAIAWPAIAWLMGHWLQDFPYRIGLPWMAYAAGALAVVMFAWLAMASTTVRAATRSPVHALRYE